MNELDRQPAGGGPALVVIGHLAWNENRVGGTRHLAFGGAAYYFAVGAAAATPGAPSGIVATVGPDLDLGPLAGLADPRGVRVLRCRRTARFVVEQYPGHRVFQAPEWGAAEVVDPSSFPEAYRCARHAHLATAPPWQQREWLQWLRANHPSMTVSADSFEEFAKTWPEESRDVLDSVDLAFLNEHELQLLRPGSEPWPRVPHVLKLGRRGAEYVGPDVERVRARPKREVTVRDTTGAGDLLAGAFLSLRCRGASAALALQAAVELATASVTEMGMGEAVTATARTLPGTHSGAPVLRNTPEHP